MPAIEVGVLAPTFKLPVIDAGEFSLADALKRGPVLLAFFKISCPICQYAFPFYDRLYRALDGRLSMLGISQDDRKDTSDFIREFGVSFPVALDDSKRYEVSNAYGLTNVPTIFEVEPNGRIATSCVGWSSPEVEGIFRKYAGQNELSAVPLFKPSEQVADFRAG